MTATPDPYEMLKAQLEALANSMREPWPDVAIVLFILRGAIQENSVRELVTVATEFAIARKKKIDAEQTL